MLFKILTEQRTNLTTCIFVLKLKKLLRNLTKCYVFEKIQTYTYIIEFQKRSFFYIYIFIIVDQENAINIINVDVAICIVIPIKIENSILYKLIIKYIIHKNCKNIFKIVCYNKYNRFIKYFSKSKCKKINLIYFFDYLEYCRLFFDKYSKIYKV